MPLTMEKTNIKWIAMSDATIVQKIGDFVKKNV
jgi:hypothetical protein